jgi:uncharacterized protein (DUF1501 family)
LGKDFKTVASLIKSDINTQVYYLSIGSFDTHVNQNDRQKKLFSDINEAVKSFVADMKTNGLFNNILLMTFSLSLAAVSPRMPVMEQTTEPLTRCFSSVEI